MASSHDVRDIMSLPERQGGQVAGGSGASKPRPASRAKAPRPEGITRELYALLGDNAPSLAIAAPGVGGVGKAAGFKPKFQRRPQKARKWKLTPFRNTARGDELLLSHWSPARAPVQPEIQGEGSSSIGEGSSKVAPQLEEDYKFAQFNTTSGVYSYSNDEYQQYLRDDDWSQSETDYLMELCHEYDLRFVVIQDRYEWEGGKERSIEDLKARYYAICRRLIRSRISTDDVDTRQQLLTTYLFDPKREQERKKGLARLFERTPAQLAEEEALYVEAKRLEQNEARFASEREELLRLLGGWESLPNVNPTTVAAAGAGLEIPGGQLEESTLDGKRKRRRIEPGEDSPVAAPSGSLSTKQRAELKQAASDDQHCVYRFDPAALVSSKPLYPHLVGIPSSYPPVATSAGSTNPNSNVSHGAYLRSTRLLAPRAQLAIRTAQSLAEIIPPLGPRLVFPTARNAERWEGLLGAVTSGLEMKRQLDRVESELRIARARLEAAAGGIAGITGAKALEGMAEAGKGAGESDAWARTASKTPTAGEVTTEEKTDVGDAQHPEAVTA